MKITQDEYNTLCNCGKLHYATFNIYAIKWLTSLEKLAIRSDAEDKKEIISLQIID